MHSSTIYFVGIADSFIHLFTFLSFPFLVLFVISFCAHLAFRDFAPNAVNKGKKYMKIFGIAVALSMTLATVTPSSKLLAAMIILPQIQESEVIRKQLPEVWNLAVEGIKKELKD